jgi:hypothetical protein
MQMPDLPVRPHDAVAHVEVGAGLEAFGLVSSKPLDVVRVNEREPRLHLRHRACGVEAVDPVQLLAAPHRLRRNVVRPASHVRHSLGFGERRFTPSKLLHRRPMLGDVARDPEHRRRDAVGVELRHEPRFKVPRARRRIEGEFQDTELTRLERAPNSIGPDADVLGREASVVERAPHELRRRFPRVRLDDRVDVAKAQLTVEPDHHVGRIVGEVAELALAFRKPSRARLVETFEEAEEPGSRAPQLRHHGPARPPREPQEACELCIGGARAAR